MSDANPAAARDMPTEAQPMRKCHSCGHVINESDRYCSKCGSGPPVVYTCAICHGTGKCSKYDNASLLDLLIVEVTTLGVGLLFMLREETCRHCKGTGRVEQSR
jgi:RNA polymerase subunit RPABC4/transcription elongation factor Spt4